MRIRPLIHVTNISVLQDLLNRILKSALDMYGKESGDLFLNEEPIEKV